MIKTLALTDDGAARIVGIDGNEGTVATFDGKAGADFKQHLFSSGVLVTIIRVPDSAPGTNPLPTALKQYGPYYDISITPAVVPSDFARVAICNVTDSSSPFYPTEPHDKLLIAHTVGSAIEVLAPVAASDLVHCTSVAGKVKSFGRFGTVVP